MTARYWSTAPLVRALRGSGFGSVARSSHRLSPTAETGPADFWEPCLSAPHAALVDARKERIAA